jgi:hypothetical protein
MDMSSSHTSDEDYGDEVDEGQQAAQEISPIIADYLNDIDTLYMSGSIPFSQYKAYEAIVN